MIYISALELALTCGLGLLVLVIPLMVRRFYASMDRRLRDVEKQMDKMKQQ
ncbi:MAG: hypothetical protein HYZ24_01030 [Chloroflexi bacterium]|nr:hypothetical protein [Chloroflexota bacterium]